MMMMMMQPGKRENSIIAAARCISKPHSTAHVIIRRSESPSTFCSVHAMCFLRWTWYSSMLPSLVGYAREASSLSCLWFLCS